MLGSLRRLTCTLLFLSTTLFLGQAAKADVVKIGVEGTINAITQEYIERAIARAEQVKADALLIEISTPGGLADSTRSIIEKMLASKVPIIVYVTPTGSRSASAGFFI